MENEAKFVAGCSGLLFELGIALNDPVQARKFSKPKSHVIVTSAKLKSVGFTDVGLYKISQSVRDYAYLILSSQASARSGIVGNTASALTAQLAFFE